MLQDYEILDKNFHSRFGEIDIVALKNRVLHFVEVKSGANSHERITKSKLSKIIKTVEFYLNIKRLDYDYQIDAIFIQDDIEHLENITI